MKSGKQKRQELKARRLNKTRSGPLKKKKERLLATRVVADRTKQRSSSCMPVLPEYYYDKEFQCIDCGKHEVWSSKQQKWWYEQIGGMIETTAIRCRACRLKERLRKAEARRVHLEGIARKKSENA